MPAGFYLYLRLSMPLAGDRGETMMLWWWISLIGALSYAGALCSLLVWLSSKDLKRRK